MAGVMDFWSLLPCYFLLIVSIAISYNFLSLILT